MTYKNDKPWVPNEYLIQCDQCGIKRYSSEIKKTWDGFLVCTTGNCYEPKDPIYWIPPVIMDPHPIVNVRPQTTVLGPSPVNVTWNNPVNPLWPTTSTGVWATDQDVWNTVGSVFDPWGNENS